MSNINNKHTPAVKMSLFAANKQKFACCSALVHFTVHLLTLIPYHP